MANMDCSPTQKSLNIDSKSLNIDSLDDELLFQILKRLPLKLVLRSKRVSKRWLNMISTVYFFKSYNRHRYLSGGSKPRFALICNFHTDDQFNIRVDYFESPNSFAADFIVAPQWLVSSSASIHVLASHHGLVLCSAISTDSWTRYFICDILYKKWVPIPQPPTYAKHARLGLLGLAPSLSVDDKNGMINSGDSNTSYGFMIVRLPNDDNLNPVVEVYNSETGVWTVSDNAYIKAPTHDNDVESSAVACSGLLFWKRSKDLLVFNPHRNGFRSLKLLNKMEDPIKKYYHYAFSLPGEKHERTSFFGECNGRLRCACYTNRSLELWELEDLCTEKWRLVDQTVSLLYEGENQMGGYGSKSHRVVSVAFHPFDEDLVFVGSTKSLTLYDMHREDSIKISEKEHYMYCSEGPLLFPTMLPWWPLS